MSLRVCMFYRCINSGALHCRSFRILTNVNLVSLERHKVDTFNQSINQYALRQTITLGLSIINNVPLCGTLERSLKVEYFSVS